MTDYNDDQLQPILTPFTNSVLRGPEGTDVGDLPCELIKEEVAGETWVSTASGWELDERQRELVAAGAHMRMTVWQHPIPPLALSIEAPFCGSCTTQCVYVKSERVFACANQLCINRGADWMKTGSTPRLVSGPQDDEILKDAAARADTQSSGAVEAAPGVDGEGEGDG